MRFICIILKTMVWLSTTRSTINDSGYGPHSNALLTSGSSSPESVTDKLFKAEHLINESFTIKNSTEDFSAITQNTFFAAESFTSSFITDKSLTNDRFPLDSPSLIGHLESVSCRNTSFTNDSGGELSRNGSSRLVTFSGKSCTVSNSTVATDPTATVFSHQLSLGSAIISCLTITVACAAVFNNSLLLWAIARVDNSVLKAKRFIQNMSAANLLLPILIACNPFFIATAAGGMGAQPTTCVLGVYSIARNMLGLSQPVCVLGLACDRIYAIALPLTYKIVGYPRLLRSVILVLPWFVSLTLLGIFMYVVSNKSQMHGIKDESMICHVFLRAALKSESSKVLDSFLISANVFSFVVYISLFAFYKYQQQSIHNISITPVKKASVSLVRTYFLLNVTTLALYLPAPIYALLNQDALGQSLTNEASKVIPVLMIVYLLNTCLDPLILMSRVPSIRQNLPIKFKQMPVRHSENSSQKNCSRHTELGPDP